ncbi:hypothetical protein KP509_14G040300 [Ceratopteris richardii]|uniref:Mitochondrial ribonuclease P catalytic subunit n=1 Tax=Ceratopteris richardii TaxID=49495 RepID=A0A8T2TC17_CERRI|nr:hypothetical protein KP509_14G040300 [Ceratopteris richardii]KAH7415385.1 hypothetical protein KP509_14G040300 [Ceratopteris richardii]
MKQPMVAATRYIKRCTFQGGARIGRVSLLQNSNTFQNLQRTSRHILSSSFTRASAEPLSESFSDFTSPIEEDNCSSDCAGKCEQPQKRHLEQFSYVHGFGDSVRRDVDDGAPFLEDSRLSGFANEASMEIQHNRELSTANNEKIVSAGIDMCEQLFIRITSSRKFCNSKSYIADPEASKARLHLSLCSRFAHFHGALKVFDQVKERQVKLNVHDYNILLYLCSGVASGNILKDSWKSKKKPNKTLDDPLQDNSNASENSEKIEHNISSNDISQYSPEDVKLAIERAADILEHMLENGVNLNESTYTSIIRLAVANDDGDLAFKTIKLMESSGISPKLRSYGPVVHLFCQRKEDDKAYEVDDHMLSLQIQPDESILDSLLKVSIHAGHDDKVYTYLHRLRKSLRVLLPATVKTIENWFTCKASVFAGKANWENLPSDEECELAIADSGGGHHGLGWLGMGPWQVRRTHIHSNGTCMSCGEKLCVVDLNMEDTDVFAESVARLACQRMKLNTFHIFQDWLGEHGPFDAVVDGANVGLYNPKVYNGFSLRLLDAVVRRAESRFCTEKLPLVLLHGRHKSEIMKSQAGVSFISRFMKNNALYFTPSGADDDWFWLYAAVKCRSVLVTNDNMRDHIFALLGNNFFPKWKERHQVRFSITHKSVDIHLPPPYSTILQESQRGSWHIPQAACDDSEVVKEWLCVTRPRDMAFSQET